MTDNPTAHDLARQRATEYVLQQYHLTDLQDARDRLTPVQFEGVLRQIDAITEQIMAPPQPRPAQSATRGVSTPFGSILPITGLLLVAIWIVFALESLQPGGSTSTAVLYQFGADISDTLSSGQDWRLLAACFLHIGLFHIISNSIALVWLGSAAERFYGPLRYLGIYLAAGIGGSVVATLTSAPFEISAGASGAIMGLLGALLAGSFRNRAVIGAAAGRQIFQSLAVVLVFNLFIGFSTPGISNAAHLGGAATGAILALLIPYHSPRYPRAYARAANIFSAALIVASLSVLVTYVGAH